MDYSPNIPFTQMDQYSSVPQYKETKEAVIDYTVIDKLFLQVETRPSAVAITTTANQITYKQLWNMIGNLANKLKWYGCHEGDVIAFQLQDPLLIAASMYAIMSIGATYLPLEPDVPETHRAYVLADCDCHKLIVEEETNDIVNEKQDLTIILSSVNALLSSANKFIPTQLSPDDLAYIIYTSGSTGKPKGVKIKHKSLANFVDWRIQAYHISPNDVTLQLLTPAFDGYASNFYMSTLSGGNLVCLNNKERKDIEIIERMIQKYSVTNMSVVPAIFKAILYNLSNDVMKSFRFIVLAGEVTSPKTLSDSKKSYPNLQLINEYGPTECTITALYNENLLKTAPNNIGKPIYNTYFYILDEHGKLQDSNLPGELCLGGVGVAKGYVNEDLLQDDTRFICDPFDMNKRLYRTGDWVRLLNDGTIEYLGRTDRQIKVNGYRVDLFEVENKLYTINEIQEAAAVACKGIIYAFIVTQSPIDNFQIKNKLEACMPAYMVPTTIITLKSLPMLTNGKVDYQALQQLIASQESSAITQFPTYSDIEIRVMEIWKDLLKVDEINLDSNFFILGGNSLLATILVNRLNKDLSLTVSLREFLSNPTVRTITTINKNALSGKLSIVKAPVTERYPLSSAQKRLLILHQIEPESLNYNMTTIIKVKENLSSTRLETCLNTLISRHEILRSSFQVIDGEPVQQIYKEVPFNFVKECMPDSDVNSFLKNFIKPFDLNKAPLFRIAAIHTGQETILVFDFHHIIMDGSSQLIFLQELFSLYQGENLESLPYRYMDYVYTQQQYEANMQDHKAYWMNQFKSIPAPLDLPIDYPRTALQNFEGADLDFELPISIGSTLKETASELGCTVFHLLYSAFAVLMNVYTGQDDIVIGTIADGRTQLEWSSIVGLFVNTLAIRTRPEPNKLFSDYVLEVKKAITEGILHQEYQYDDLVRTLNVQKENSFSPLIDVLMAYNEFDFTRLNTLPFEYKTQKFESNTTKFNLTLIINQNEDHITGTFQYATTLFKPDTILKLKDRYVTILTSIPSWKNQKLSNCSVISKSEQYSLLYDFQGNIRKPKDVHLASLLENSAYRFRDRPAVVCDEITLTYAELYERATKIALQLLELGVVAGNPVAILCGRSISFLAAVIGILRLGATYVPIDPAYPDERIQTMLKESKANVVISEFERPYRINPEHAMQWLIIDNTGKCTEQFQYNYKLLPNISELSVNLPIYRIFTSGSTGTPKAVEIRMQSFLNLLDWYISDFNFSLDSRMLLVASVSFDLAQKNLFASLVVGGCLYIYSDLIYDCEKINKLISVYNITTVNCTPSAFYPLVESGQEDEYRNLTSLRTVFLGGETIDAQRLRDWALGAGRCCQVVNTYGPTECTDILTSYVLREEDYTGSHSVPIGYPIPNARLYVINSTEQLSPIGVPGELYAGGIGLSMGYTNAEALNKEKFIELPILPGQKLYRTGDMVRWNEKGILEFIGRRDKQIKIRGYRIEIGEIETCINRFEGISEAVVTLEGEDDNKYLNSYIVMEENSTLDEEQLRAFLRKHLPAYMVPSCFILVNAIPLTVNGKIDRQKLATIHPVEEISSVSEATEMSSDIELRLIDIWKEVLGVNKVTVTDDFFELGGHSLSVIRLLAKLNQTFPVSIDFSTFMKNNSIQQLVTYYMTDTQSSIDPMSVNSNDIMIKEASNSQILLHDSKNAYAPFPMNDTQISYMLGRNDCFVLGGVSTHLYMEINTHLDVLRLERCLNQLILRHPMLCAIFSSDGSQKILENVPYYHIEQVNANSKGLYEAEQLVEKEREIMSHRIFEYDKWPLFEVRAVIMPDKSTRILFGFDALLGDGYSLQLMAEDLVQLYNNDAGQLPDLEITYRDYCLAMEQYKLTDDYKKDQLFWTEKLVDFPSSPAIPLLNQPEDIEQPHFNKLTHIMSSDQWSKIKKCARSMQITPSALLCTVYARLLSYWANQPDMGLNLTVFNRFPLHPDVDRIVGDFTSILLIDIHLCEHGDLRTDAINVHNTIMQALAHRHYSGINCVRQLAKSVGDQKQVTMPIVFTGALFDNEFINADEKNSFGEVTYVSTQTSQVYIDNKVYIGSEGDLHIEWDYVRELFCEDDIQYYFDLYVQMLYLVSTEEQPNLRKILIPSLNDMHLITKYNNTKCPKKVALLHNGVTKYAHATPNHIAIIDGEDSITYAELERQSNRIANFLIENYGAEPGKNIAVWAERKFSTIINIVAILKTGATYIPVNPEYPMQRVTYIVEHTQSLCILGMDDEMITDVTACDDEFVPRIITPDNNAYIIFTSGSTGVPKGVTITHAAAMNTIFDIVERLNLSKDDKILGISSISFDLSVFDIFGTFASGATLVIVKDQRNMNELHSLITRHRITIWNSVPAVLSIYIDSLDCNERQDSIRHILLSGDWIPVSLPGHAQNYFPYASVMSLGGATEASIWSVYFPTNLPAYGIASVPYGMPLSNQKLYVLNYWKELCPLGVPGELYIGGDGLASGYWNDSEKTKEAFIFHSKFGRLYRTGDFGVLHKEGIIEFLGRRDNQVKLHGYRVELSEIELAVQKRFPHVACVSVITTNETGSKKICLYLEKRSNISKKELYECLKDTLPAYMIPEHIVFVESFPLTINGKIDRNALPKLQELPNNKEQDYMAPENRTEETLQTIWKKILFLDKVATTDNFFEVGGDSLCAIQLVNEIQKAFGITMTYRNIYEYTTIQKQAILVRTIEKKDYESIPVSKVQPFYPLSLSQKRFYILNRMAEQNTAYNLPMAVRIVGNIDLVKLKTVISSMLQRHDVFRTSFHVIDGEPAAIVHEKVEFQLEEIEITKNGTVEHVMESCCRPFDISKAPLFRATVIRCNRNEIILFLDMHHIISDGMTMELVIAEIIKLYNGEELETPSLQYHDYVIWAEHRDNSQRSEQEKFWMDTLKGYTARVELPLDFLRPSSQSFLGNTISCEVDSTVYSRIKQLCGELNMSLFMIIAAVYGLVLHKHTGMEDILIGTPVLNRNHADVQKMMGLFINTVLLRSYPSANKSIKKYLEEVQNIVLDVLSNQEYPFELLVDHLDEQRDVSRNALYDYMLVVKSEKDYIQPNPDFQIIPIPFDAKSSKCDLTIQAIECNGSLQLNAEYCTNLFSSETVSRFLSHFQQALRRLPDSLEICIGEFEILPREEIIQIVESFNQTEAKFDDTATLHSFFETQVRKTPDAIAVTCLEGSWTYGELNQKSNQLAHFLIRKGVQIDQPVGIMINRSAYMVIAILAILKAGGAYLPIDVNCPVDRVNFMLSNSNAHILLTAGTQYHNDKVFIVDITQENVYDENINNPTVDVQSKNLAYIIYTSGSTGKPKGVMIEHQSVINRLQWMQAQYPLHKDDTILQKTPYTFDVSVWELFWWQFIGAHVCLLEPGAEKNPEMILQYIKENKVTILHFVPSMLLAFLEYVSYKDISWQLLTIRHVFVSGEALHIDILKLYSKVFPSSSQLHNLYGPTEATVDVSYYDCTGNEEDFIPIGQPIYNTRFYVLDKQQRILPINAYGELYIAGCCLARGYAGNPDITDQAFFDIWIGGKKERAYKTGDIVRWRSNGMLEFKGRLDHQVKIRGYRVELQDIEANLVACTYVKEGVVLAERTGSLMSLIAFLTLNKNGNVEQVRDFLEKSLPSYMIPSRMISLPELPKLPNGKVDRQALHNRIVNEESTKTNSTEPLTEMENEVLEAWKEVLQISQVDITSNFFEIGGNSILAIKLEVELEKKKLFLPYDALFTYKTIQSQAEYLLGKLESSKSETCISIEKSSVDKQNPYCFEPFNEFFFRTCFYNAFLPIIRAASHSILPFLVCCVPLYKYDESGIGRSGIQYYEAKTWESLCDDIGISVCKTAYSSNIVNDLKEKVFQERPCIVWLDPYYIPNRKDAYMKKHIQHCILVYDYDTITDSFFVIEHQRKEELSYAHMKLPAKVLYNAYEGLMQYISQHDRLDSYSLYIFDLKNSSSDVYTDKECRAMYIQTLQAGRIQIEKSLAQLDKFVTNSKSWLCNSEYFLTNAEDILECLNEICNAKLAEVELARLILFDEQINLRQKIYNNWLKLRNRVAKALFKRLEDIEGLNQLVDTIQSIAVLEKRYYENFGIELTKRQYD